jgi:D-glycero-D-manno-heptose 1,7-bisphosphate phosphatase
MARVRVLVLDRDGTLIEHVPYLSDPSQVRLLPGVVDALRMAHAAGLLFCLHTNQSGVGRGLYSLADAEACTARMIEQIGLGPGLFTRSCTAPEAPDQPAIYRKPSPRFAHELLRDFSLAPEELCYVGDRGSDLVTGHAVGARAVGVHTGLDDLPGELRAAGLGHLPVFPTFRAAIEHVLSFH